MESTKNTLRCSTNEELQLILTNVRRELSSRMSKNPFSIIKEWADIKKNIRTVTYKTSFISKYKYSTKIIITENSKKEVFKINTSRNISKKETKRLVSIEVLNKCSFFDKHQGYSQFSNDCEVDDDIIKNVRTMLTKIYITIGFINKVNEAIQLFEYLTHPMCGIFFNNNKKFYKTVLLKIDELYIDFKKDKARYLKNRFEIASLRIKYFETQFV